MIYKIKIFLSVEKFQLSKAIFQMTDITFADLKKELTEIKTIVKGFKNELKGLVEIQQKLIHERLGVPIPPSPKEYNEETSVKLPKINIISIPDNYIRVAGNTFDFKSAIKDAGYAKWEQTTKSWSLPTNCLDKLISNFETLGLVRDVDFSIGIDLSVNNQAEKSGFDD